MSTLNKKITDLNPLSVLTGSEWFPIAYDPAPNYKVSLNQIAAYIGTPPSALYNPMSASGDMIFGGSLAGGFAVPSRLPIGTTGQMLGVSAGFPAWTTVATVATTGAYTDLTGRPALGTLSGLSYPGGTTTYLRADGTWAAAATTVPWGSITGTLASQTDLQTALDTKQPINPRVQSVASAATVTPTFTNDGVIITAQAAGLTLANPTGTAIDMFGIAIRIKDNGVSRSIAFGAQYRAVGVSLPVATVASKTLYIGMVYNAADTRWDVVSVNQEA